jgi:uncharacterized delta-60 repeat protein
MRFLGCVSILILFIVGVSGQEWIARYDGEDHQPETAYDIAVDNQDNVCVAGHGYRSATYIDYLTIKYNSDGDTVWVRYYDGGQAFYDYAHALAVDDSGNVYVTGGSMESGNQMGIATIKYNSAGVVQWVTRYEGPADDDDEAYDIALDESGNIYAAGFTRHSSNDIDFITIKYNNAGDTLWTALYDCGDNVHDWAEALAVDDSGNVYVTGVSYSFASYYDYATIKYSTSGVQRWVTFYNGETNTYDDHPYDIAVCNGGVVVTGETEGTGSGRDYMTIKYSSSGDTLWEKRYDGPGNADDAASAVAIDTIGNVYVTGYSYGMTTERDYATIKYYANGDTAWVARYDGPDHDDDEATAISVDSDGNTYVTGQSYATQPYTPEYDYLTVVYNSSGVQQWSHRYNGEGDTQDHAYAITLDNGGLVYVTGSSIGTTGFNDFLTIKYLPTAIEEHENAPVAKKDYGANIFKGRLKMPAGKSFRIFDIMGREVRTMDPAPGIYFVERNGERPEKIIKIR